MKKERKFGLKEFPRPLGKRYGGGTASNIAVGWQDFHSIKG